MVIENFQFIGAYGHWHSAVVKTKQESSTLWLRSPPGSDWSICWGRPISVAGAIGGVQVLLLRPVPVADPTSTWPVNLAGWLGCVPCHMTHGRDYKLIYNFGQHVTRVTRHTLGRIDWYSTVTWCQESGLGRPGWTVVNKLLVRTGQSTQTSKENTLLS